MRNYNIAVYCGSSAGNQSIYSDAAKQLAQMFIKHKINLVYGGGRVGLMGIIADEMLRGGGEVIGIIPQALVNWEVAHEGLSDLRVVKTMHERKALIDQLSDAFILLPGGTGSLDEFFEMVTWTRLGYNTKPIGMLNSNGYYDLLLDFMKFSLGEGFITQKQMDSFSVDDSPEILLQKMRVNLEITQV